MNTLRIKIRQLKQKTINDCQAASSSKLTCNLHLCKEDSNNFEKSYKEVKCQRFSTIAVKHIEQQGSTENIHCIKTCTHAREVQSTPTPSSLQISKESLWDVQINIMNVQLINLQQLYHATISKETRLSTKKWIKKSNPLLNPCNKDLSENLIKWSLYKLQ